MNEKKTRHIILINSQSSKLGSYTKECLERGAGVKDCKYTDARLID